MEGELVSSMRTTVDNIEGGDGKDVRGLDSGEFCKVLIDGDALREPLEPSGRICGSIVPFERRQPQ